MTEDKPQTVAERYAEFRAGLKIETPEIVLAGGTRNEQEPVVPVFRVRTGARGRYRTRHQN